MDDEGAEKVIAAIERLAIRIAKIDETSLEAAAVANEARRAAMDAADATDPKRTAEHMAKSLTPVMKTLDAKVAKVFDGMGGKLTRATDEAQKARHALEKAQGDYRYVNNRESERGRAHRFKFAAAAAIVTFLFCSISWVTHSHTVDSVRSCRAFGGHPHLKYDDRTRIECSFDIGKVGGD